MSTMHFSFRGPDLTSPEAGQAPVREVPPVGDYHAKIVDIKPGMTKQTPPKQKMVVEFILLMTMDGDRASAGRRVFQDYILETEIRESGNDIHTYRLRQLLSACKIPIVNNSFDAAPMVGAEVKIRVTHRFGTPMPPDYKVPVFANVQEVDMLPSAANAEDLL